MMKKTLIRIKEGAKNLLIRISRHETILYISIVVFMLVFALFIRGEIKHSAEILKIQKEKAILIYEIQSVNSLSQDKSSVIQFQGEILTKQRENLDKADEMINMQNNLLEKLIQHLKNVGEWPPKIKPIDPDKWT